jgi:hypothetical protein
MLNFATFEEKWGDKNWLHLSHDVLKSMSDDELKHELYIVAMIEALDSACPPPKKEGAPFMGYSGDYDAHGNRNRDPKFSV